ncbi:MAG: hypothetical protein ABSB49_17340 [Polyangia bacterium]
MARPALPLILGVALDRVLGEPRRWHPRIASGHEANLRETGRKRRTPTLALGTRRSE